MFHRHRLSQRHCPQNRRRLVPLLVGGLMIAIVGCIPAAEETQVTPLSHQCTPQISTKEVANSLPPTTTPIVKETELCVATPTSQLTTESTAFPSEPTSTQTAPASQQSEQSSIHLQWGTIDTNRGEPQLPDNLRIDAYAPYENGYYIVQFHDKILPEWTMDLEQAGVNVLGYVPNNAFVVQMTNTQRDLVASLDQVQWVGIFQPAYRLSSRLSGVSQGEETLIVLTFPGVDMERMAANVQELGGLIESQSENEFRGKMKIRLDLQNLVPLARLNGVMWIEPWIEPELNTSP